MVNSAGKISFRAFGTYSGYPYGSFWKGKGKEKLGENQEFAGRNDQGEESSIVRCGQELLDLSVDAGF